MRATPAGVKGGKRAPGPTCRDEGGREGARAVPEEVRGGEPQGRACRGGGVGDGQGTFGRKWAGQ